jgi:signal transduction histidine kinase
MDLDALAEWGTGLANVRERLRFFFDGEAELRVRSQGVELSLPRHAQASE